MMENLKQNYVKQGRQCMAYPHYVYVHTQKQKEMTFSQVKFTYSSLIIVSLLMGCKHEEPKIRAAINSFSMQVNGQLWTPFQSKDDPCTSTYSGSYADLGDIPFYTIYAYRDPAGRADAYSDNLLRMQVMNVTEPGVYQLNGTYKEDFDSYFLFVVQQPAGNATFYVNDPSRSPFIVNVAEIPTRKLATIPGIKGFFSGILYNEADPSDSLIIEKGKFAFDTMSASDKYHCGL